MINGDYQDFNSEQVGNLMIEKVGFRMLSGKAKESRFSRLSDAQGKTNAIRLLHIYVLRGTSFKKNSLRTHIMPYNKHSINIQ